MCGRCICGHEKPNTLHYSQIVWSYVRVSLLQKQTCSRVLLWLGKLALPRLHIRWNINLFSIIILFSFDNYTLSTYDFVQVWFVNMWFKKLQFIHKTYSLFFFQPQIVNVRMFKSHALKKSLKNIIATSLQSEYKLMNQKVIWLDLIWVKSNFLNHKFTSQTWSKLYVGGLYLTLFGLIMVSGYLLVPVFSYSEGPESRALHSTKAYYARRWFEWITRLFFIFQFCFWWQCVYCDEDVRGLPT